MECSLRRMVGRLVVARTVPPGADGRASRRDNGAIEVRPLESQEVDGVGAVLGLARLDQGDGFYLVAWDDRVPVGHLHLALTDPPEIEDVEVVSGHRRRGVARALIAAAETEALERGVTRLRVGMGADNASAQALYRTSGFADVGLAPQRVVGTIQIRTGSIDVDDIIITWEKRLTGHR